MQHDGAIDAREKALGGLRIAGHDAIGVLRAILVNVRDGRVHSVDYPHRDNGVEILRIPILLGGRRHPPVGVHARLVAAHCAPGVEQRPHQCRQVRAGAGAVDQQGLGRTAHPGAPQLRVEHDVLGHCQIGGPIDVDMAHALEMTDHGHTSFLLDASDQTLAAARHDHVDVVHHVRQHVTDRGPVGRGNELNAAAWQAGDRQPLIQARMDGGARMHALRAAPQYDGIARFQTQRSGIGGDVRTALINDADDAQRDSHALNVHAVRPGPLGEHGSDRIGEVGDVVDPASHRLDAFLIQLQPVEQRRRQVLCRRLPHIAVVGRDDLVAARTQARGGSPQRTVLLIGRCQAQGKRRRPRTMPDGSHDVRHRRRRANLAFGGGVLVHTGCL